MQLLKLVFISILFFFLLLTGIGLLLPANVTLSRAINLSNPQKNILAVINDTTSWKTWHPLYSNSAQNGQRIKKNFTDSSVNFLIQSPAGSMENTWQLHRYTHTPVVTLQWAMQLHSGPFPWQRFRSLFYEGTYGVVMEEGLRRLDSLATD